MDAERLANLDLAVDLAYADQKRLAMTGTLDAAPGALPANLADVIGTHVELALRAGETAPGRYALDDLRLQMASLSLQGSGSADLARRQRPRQPSTRRARPRPVRWSGRDRTGG